MFWEIKGMPCQLSQLEGEWRKFKWSSPRLCTYETLKIVLNYYMCYRALSCTGYNQQIILAPMDKSHMLAKHEREKESTRDGTETQRYLSVLWIWVCAKRKLPVNGWYKEEPAFIETSQSYNLQFAPKIKYVFLDVSVMKCVCDASADTRWRLS